jgi:hypothetical protein
MASFSKPIRDYPDENRETLPAKRKRTINPKLISEDNVHQDAVKRRRQHGQHPNPALHSATQNPKTSVTEKPPYSRHAPVEEHDDDDNRVFPNPAPRNPRPIPEASESSDDEIEILKHTPVHVDVTDDSEEEGEEVQVGEEEALQEETDEQELGKL